MEEQNMPVYENVNASTETTMYDTQTEAVESTEEESVENVEDAE